MLTYGVYYNNILISLQEFFSWKFQKINPDSADACLKSPVFLLKFFVEFQKQMLEKLPDSKSV